MWARRARRAAEGGSAHTDYYRNHCSISATDITRAPLPVMTWSTVCGRARPRARRAAEGGSDHTDYYRNHCSISATVRGAASDITRGAPSVTMMSSSIRMPIPL